MKAPLALAASFLALAATSNAKLVAWYPLDETANAPETVTEAVSGTDTETFLIGFDPDPAFSFITRGHPSARPDLGTSYLIEKGGGLDLGGGGPVQPTDKFTIAFWFQPLTLNAFDRFFESQRTNTNAQDGIRIDTGGGAGNHVRVLVRDNNGASNTQLQHPTVLRNDGTWYFFAFRYDSEGFDNDPFQLTLIEATGDPVDENTVFDATALQNTVNTGPIGYPHAINSLVGVEVPDNPNHGNNLHAALDEYAFWDNSDGNGVLSDAQLADVYNFGASGVQLIESFSSDTDSMAPGASATLSWEVAEPFATLTLDDGAGNVTDLAPLTTAGAGSTSVTATSTTVFTLRSTRGEAANTATVRILVGAAPDIATFSASTTFIQLGGTVDLSWDTTGAGSLTITPGDIDVSALANTTVTPTETTTYTLSATNSFGTTTTDVSVTVLEAPVPTHRYVASTDGNDDIAWTDEIGTANWTFTGGFLDNPLVTPSTNTNITASYVAGGLGGGAVGTFPFPEFTAEIWLRPADLTPDHEVIFETGGGQNGISALITESGFRFLGSALNERTVDITVPTNGLKLDDFVQLVFSNSKANGSFDVSVRDTAGNLRTTSEPATGTIGNNGAGLFTWASGAVGAADVNLGGRTELADTTPLGMTGFAGEIAIVNIYDRILEPADLQLTFDTVVTGITPQDPSPLTIGSITRDQLINTLTLSYNSTPGNSYDVQFSTDLINWFELEGAQQANANQTTRSVSHPPNQDFFYVRVREVAP